MTRVLRKSQLCSCEVKFFKSKQGHNGHTLFDRFPDIQSIVAKRVDPKYRDFLAHPEENEDIIIWYSKPFNETPRHLLELDGEERAKYEKIKNDNIDHFTNIITILQNEDKSSEAEYLTKALKYINNDFVYCYDGIAVLGIWGMQLKENLRQPMGVVRKDLFVKKDLNIHERVEPEQDEVETPESPNENPTEKKYTIRFNSGQDGELSGESEVIKVSGDSIAQDDIPEVLPKEGYEFTNWNENPNNYTITGDKEFTAQYKSITPPILTLPWYTRFWNWLRGLFAGKGCLKWLLWLLLLLILLLLFCWLLKGCNSENSMPIPSPIDDKPWIHEDPRVGDGGGIYDPGNPYESLPTPPEYSHVLPPDQGLITPIDSAKIIREPGKPVIISNRLNILMENEDKSILDLAKDFKKKYPEDKYQVVYYDDVVKRMQIEIPPEERINLKTEIPEQFAPEYELFVFDESLFQAGFTPNDPAFSSSDKSWYLNAVNALTAWDITRGSPKLTVAIVDNGFSLDHSELTSKVVMPYNVWLHSNQVFSQRIDHGTHVAGTALAIANNGKGLCGVSPECVFMPVQVANRQGLMTTTSILDGILYALYQGADVINVSLGMEFTGTLAENEQRNLQDNYFKEEERLWNKVMEISNKHNAIIIVAAGNANMLAGVNPMSRPKNFIVVSGVDKSNSEYRKTGFSNYGDYSTVSAPGVDIYSTVGNNDYQIMEGTSMAAPIVAGAVALMKSLNKDLTAEQIVCVLQGTGKPAQGKVGNLIQIDKALQRIKSGDYTDCDHRPETPSTGDVQILLSWNNYNDLDLVCTDPNNETVWFKNKNISSGGKLEIDMNVEYPDSKTPIENIFWPSGEAPSGTYSVDLVYYKKHEEPNETPYKISIKYGDITEEYDGVIGFEDETINICMFTFRGEDTPRNTNPPSLNRTREELIREKKELQRRMDQINRELLDL